VENPEVEIATNVGKLYFNFLALMIQGASPANRISSTSISSRSLRAAARIASGTDDLRVVFSDLCMFGCAEMS
jgi:hypothetical protein